MNFIVSSTELLRGLLSGLRVISNKTTTPILDNFLFVLRGNSLEVTASDSETTLRTVIPVDEVMEEGSAAVPAKILTDSLKEFPDMPIEFKTLEDNNTMQISWATGAQKIPFFPADYYPELPALVPAETLSAGLGYTLYATADEVLRPVMNGVLFDLTPESTSLVASDSHKLVCYTRTDIRSEQKSSFILPKKPAAILRGLYPAYRTVIPKNNQNKMLISRTTLLNAAKRVSVCSNQATSSMKFSLSFNTLVISAQDTGFSISAHETLPCQYDGEPMDIGFKSTFLIEILSNLPYEEICFELADPARAALIVPAEDHNPDEDICSLLMPIRIPN